jgi:hypothetical protein
MQLGKLPKARSTLFRRRYNSIEGCLQQAFCRSLETSFMECLLSECYSVIVRLSQEIVLYCTVINVPKVLAQTISECRLTKIFYKKNYRKIFYDAGMFRPFDVCVYETHWWPESHIKRLCMFLHSLVWLGRIPGSCQIRQVLVILCLNFHFAPPCLRLQWTSQHASIVGNLNWTY